MHTPYSTVSFRKTLSELEWLSEIFNDTKRRDSWASCNQCCIYLRDSFIAFVTHDKRQASFLVLATHDEYSLLVACSWGNLSILEKANSIVHVCDGIYPEIAFFNIILVSTVSLNFFGSAVVFTVVPDTPVQLSVTSSFGFAEKFEFRACQSYVMLHVRVVSPPSTTGWTTLHIGSEIAIKFLATHL